MDVIRTLVSGRRRRYRDDVYDLDLTYITSRLIAMGFPASGIEAAYRNPVEDVARFLNSHHEGNYMIFNLSERPYNYSLFEGRVIDCGWPDHHTAPLAWLIDIAKAMDGWLASSSEHVAVVHCLAGKGRTGVAIAAYLLYSGAVLSPDWKASDYEDGLSLDVPALLSQVFEAADEGDGEDDEDSDGGSVASKSPQTEDLPPQHARPDSNDAEEGSKASGWHLDILPGQTVHEQLPSAAEMAARAILAFVRSRGDGLNFAAQRRSVRYTSVLIRQCLVDSLEEAAASVKSAMAMLAPGSQEQQQPQARPEDEGQGNDGAEAATESGSAVDGSSDAASPPAAPSLPRIRLEFGHALRAVTDLQLPKAPTLLIYTIVLHGVPASKPIDGPGAGCTPSIQLRSLPFQGNDGHVELFDSSWASPKLASYTQEDTAIVIPMNAAVKGDVLLRCLHHKSDGKGTKELFRYTFNTSFIELGQVHGANVHRAFAGDLDIDNRKRNARRLPKGFYVDLLYEYAGKSDAPATATGGSSGTGTRKPFLDNGAVECVVVSSDRMAGSPGAKEAAYGPLPTDGAGPAAAGGAVKWTTDGTVASDTEVATVVRQLEQGGVSV